MPRPLDDALSEELHDLGSRNRLRRCPRFEGNSRLVSPVIDGRQAKLSFSSNDYLGLASHPALVAAAQECLGSAGVGASASRLVSGDRPEHRQLEAQLAAFAEAEACLLFPTGYQANLGVITALAGQDDLIVSDALNHASLIDGCRLSRAYVKVYEHAGLEAADTALASLHAPSGKPFRRKILVTESVFSMDGDIAPLAGLSSLCLKHNAVLVVDEAHAIGALGPRGRGLSAGLPTCPEVRIGTLGKAFGTAGGFVLGSKVLREYLVNRARTFIYTTATPPSVAAATLAALEIIRSSEGDERRDRLAERTQQLHQALHLSRAATPITPLVVGSDKAALEASTHLLSQGIYIQAIRPPTVPEGTSRLRITLSAAHEAADIEQLARACAALKLDLAS